MAGISFLQKASQDARQLPEIICPTNRLTLEEVLISLQEGKTEPRQPHDFIDGLGSESQIAKAVFRSTILPVLKDILASHIIKDGPKKNPERVADKVAGKLDLDIDHIQEYKASGDIHYGLNCDYIRDSQLVGGMNFIRRASDLFQGPGVLRLSKNGGQPVDIFILDVENGFVEEVAHKPKLKRINLKLAIPISLADGTRTFHVLEHKIYLKASQQNESEGTRAWGDLRTLQKQENLLQAAFDQVAGNSPEAASLLNEFMEVAAQKEAMAKYRKEINARDESIKGIHALTGYKPETTEGKVRDLTWGFTPLQTVVADILEKNSAPETINPPSTYDLKMA
ncbi:MAG: hypothetical protein JNL76_02390 [Alphaproteobacteria bacterium]|nr:hypothetical protein [Alphaproteobacteria bacterium]